jgi:hypothetical protein
MTLENTSTVRLTADNLTYVNYQYCPDDYINVSWGRSVIRYAVGFFAIGLLLVSVGLFYSVARDAGIVTR